MLVTRFFPAAFFVAATVLALGACDDDDVQRVFGNESITITEFSNQLRRGPTRVEVDLTDVGLTAREVEIEEFGNIFDNEQVIGRVTGVEVDGNRAQITLDMGNLEVVIPDNAQLVAQDEEVSFADFLNRLNTVIDTGAAPTINAVRTAPAQPQAPNDPTFIAQRVILEDEARRREIEVNMDADNFEDNPQPAAGEPDAWLRVLGLRVELRAREDITEFESEEDL